MVVLITGASHTGKTLLAQKLLEKYGWPYLSMDWLKMGLIRSGNMLLTPEDDAQLCEYLWPVVREMIKTVIENGQNLIVEGCYIPAGWKDGFKSRYLDEIRFFCLVMSRRYIESSFREIKAHASDIERRLDDSYCTMESVIRDNEKYLEMCLVSGCGYVLIDGEYNVDVEL